MRLSLSISSLLLALPLLVAAGDKGLVLFGMGKNDDPTPKSFYDIQLVAGSGQWLCASTTTCKRIEGKGQSMCSSYKFNHVFSESTPLVPLDGAMLAFNQKGAGLDQVTISQVSPKKDTAQDILALKVLQGPELSSTDRDPYFPIYAFCLGAKKCTAEGYAAIHNECPPAPSMKG